MLRFPRTLEEDPAHVRVKQSAIDVVGIVVAIGVEVMLAMVADPGRGTSLQGYHAARRERVFQPGRHAKAPVREQPVIAYCDAEAGHHVEKQHDREIRPAEVSKRSHRTDVHGCKVDS